MTNETRDEGREEAQSLSTWAPIVGKWSFDGGRAVFTGYDDPSFKIGIAVTDLRTTGGVFRANVELQEVEHGCGHFVLGYAAKERIAYTVGIGGYDRAYSVTEFFQDRGSRCVFRLGRKDNLQPNRNYALEVKLRGQNLQLSVDKVQVLEINLPHPLPGNQIGIKGYGDRQVTFSNVEVTLLKPRAFVVMQFTEPYNSLWKAVIKPVAKEAGFHAFRADDVYRPGIVLQDIVRGIAMSEVVIAEVTPRNPNVFYELGYAHALGTPTVLLAEQPEEGGSSLPFDISGYRCIFYEDAIRGKSKVEAALKRHLGNIRARRTNDIE